MEKGKWWKKLLRCWLQWRQGQWWNERVVWKLLVSSWARDSTWPPDQTSGLVFYLAAMVWGLMLPGSTCEVMSAPVVIHLANSATLSWRMPPISYPYVHCWKQSAKNNSAMSHLSSRKPIYLTLPWPGYVCKEKKNWKKGSGEKSHWGVGFSGDKVNGGMNGLFGSS